MYLYWNMICTLAGRTSPHLTSWVDLSDRDVIGFRVQLRVIGCCRHIACRIESGAIFGFLPDWRTCCLSNIFCRRLAKKTGHSRRPGSARALRRVGRASGPAAQALWSCLPL
jgi:hypothetical protein